MTNIAVTVSVTSQPLPAGTVFGGINVDVTDNSGNNLNGQMLNGSETPPWTHTFSGASGPNPVVVTLQAFDVGGNTMTQPVVVKQTTAGGGFTPGGTTTPPPANTFPAPVGATIAVS
jgi:hypothetical protein